MTNILYLAGTAYGAAPWDITGGSYDSVNFSVGTQDGSPRGIHFSGSGLDMYMVGVTNDTVYQYSLSTAWDLSTASYASKSISVTTEVSIPMDLALSHTGAELYVLGADNVVYQYDLSTPFDVSTASYASKSLSTAAQDTSAQGITFSRTGSKMYMSGNTNNTVYQYGLTTEYDLSTASYDSKSFSVASQGSSPVDVSISPDGKKMLVLETSVGNKLVNQYTLSTAFDVSAASYDSITLDYTSEITTSSALFVNPAGDKLYIMNTGDNNIYQYSV